MLKHRLKLFLREAYARLLFHTGLHRVVDRLSERRLFILFGHCVDAPECNGSLSSDMRIRGENLERILGWFGQRYELTTVAGGMAAVESRESGRSLVALTMDDGYRDNRTHLLPLLERTGARATVFLETRPLDERRVNWTHKFFWLTERLGPAEFGRRYGERAANAETKHLLREALLTEPKLEYRIKKILKYDAPPAERDELVNELFAEEGGDERALCEQLYLDWEDARALHAAGVEIGGHTVHHAILSRLSAEEAAREVQCCASSLEAGLGAPGETFAYPFGRRWDYSPEAIEAVRQAGYRWAVNTHAGVNKKGAKPYELRRLPIDDTSELHLLVAEACGGFELLRRFGLDLAE